MIVRHQRGRDGRYAPEVLHVEGKKNLMPGDRVETCDHGFLSEKRPNGIVIEVSVDRSQVTVLWSSRFCFITAHQRHAWRELSKFK